MPGRFLESHLTIILRFIEPKPPRKRSKKKCFRYDSFTITVLFEDMVRRKLRRNARKAANFSGNTDFSPHLLTKIACGAVIAI